MKKPMTNSQYTVAILDLLVLGMYADGHVAVVEAEQLHDFLEKRGIPEQADRRQIIGEAVTRFGREAGNLQAARKRLLELAAQLETPAAQAMALCSLERLICVDGEYPPGEESFWNEVRKAFNFGPRRKAPHR